MYVEENMKKAMLLAGEAAENGEVPVGCVVADRDGKIIGTGRNRREEGRDATAHAEIEAIRQACKASGSWRLEDCSIYVTLEPCPMCTGAIIGSRIGEVYYGAKDELTGSCGSVINLFMERYGHRPKVVSGFMAEESKELMQSFFEKLR